MEIIVLSLLTIIASFITGVSGFGYAIFLMGFFPIILGVKDANVLVSISGIAILIYLFLPFRRKVKWWIVARVFAGMAFGRPSSLWSPCLGGLLSVSSAADLVHSPIGPREIVAADAVGRCLGPHAVADQLS